ncbi:MAG TPA: outer membrane beta-barrel protein [Flavobacterium sp.]|jgi:hypothetical protein
MKHCFLALLLVACISNIHSQDFNIGVRTGVNWSKVTNTDTNIRISGYGGLFIPIKLSGKFLLQPEYNFTSQGAKESYVVHIPCYADETGNVVCPPDEVRSIKGRTDYHSLGVFNKYAISNKASIGLGASIDLKTNRRTVFDGQNDIAITAGIDYEVFKGFFVDVRIKKGLKDVLENSNFLQSNGFNSGQNNYNIVGQIGIAYIFNMTRTAPTLQ